MPSAEQHASNVRLGLLVTIIVVWATTFAAIGLSADGVTGLCLEGTSPEPVAGYTWAQDAANGCAWTLYSGTFPIRNRAADSVYLDHGLEPPDASPLLQTWHIVLILVATATTAALGIARERVRTPSDEGVVMVPAAVDAG